MGSYYFLISSNLSLKESLKMLDSVLSNFTFASCFRFKATKASVCFFR